MPLHTRSLKCLNKLERAKVGSGNRRVIFVRRAFDFLRSLNPMPTLNGVCVSWQVTHSMGGLLTKHMLMDAQSSATNARHQSLFANTMGVAFYGTPHLGVKWYFYLLRPFYPATEDLKDLVVSLQRPFLLRL
jgi:hypothetical protein